MNNLFESITTRADLDVENSQAELCQDQCASSSKTSVPDTSILNEISDLKDRRPVKKDLLSFMSQKATATSSVEQKDTSELNSAVCRRLGGVELDRHPTDLPCERIDNGHKINADLAPSNDIFSKDIIHFLSEEYGSAYQSQLDVSAIMTTLAPRTDCQSRTVSGSHLSSEQVLLPTVPAVQTDPNKLESDKTLLRNCSASSTVDPHIVDIGGLCTDDSESNPDSFNIISAVESFTSAIDQEPDEGFPFAKKLKTIAKPSKIEFSVSQSASTYHKWKSSVSVPDELVRKLPKPAVQPRLPPELAQSHSGPHVLKSSLNIDFKKQATTKAELRINSFNAVDHDVAPTVKNPTEASKNEKPPVKLVIKTLSRESKPQRVVIISCSSSVRRETANRPNDDSDSDSCGRNLTGYGATAAIHSVSVPVPQECADNGSGSGQTNQSGTEQTRSLCFCSMQPVVKLTKIGSMDASANVLPFRSFAPSTWNVLQDLFHRFRANHQRSGEAAAAFAAHADIAEKTKPMRDTPAELKRLSDSSGFCAFSNIPDKRESTKIAALYQNAILALEKNSQEHRKIIRRKARSAVRKSTARSLDSPQAFASEALARTMAPNNSSKRSKTIRRQIRLQRRAKFRRFQAAGHLQIHPPQSVHTEIKPSSSQLLDPMVVASFRRGTEEPTVDHLGRSSLHVAMGSADEATLKFVINVYKANDDLDCKDNEGLTPLMLACRNGNTKAASLLLSAGASNSTVFPATGNTLLHEATLQSNLTLVKLLVDFGADLTTKNSQGRCATDFSTSAEIREFLSATLDACSLQVSSNVRIIHSERRLPIIYVLSFPEHPINAKACVLKSELCNSLGVSPEYFDVHYSGKMKSYVLENSVILGRIMNPYLKDSFELSTRTSVSSTLLEIDGTFSSMFHEYVISDNSEERSCTTQKLRHLPPSHVSQQESSDTEEMTDDDLSEQDECEIRRDDVKEIHRSLKKLTTLEQLRRLNFNQSSVRQSSFSTECTIESTECAHHPCPESEASPTRFSRSSSMAEKCSHDVSTSCDPNFIRLASPASDSRTLTIKSEPIDIPASQDEQQYALVSEQQRPNSAIISQRVSSAAARVRFATPRSGYQLHSYAKKMPNTSHGQSSLSSEVGCNSDCFSDTSEDGNLSFADANLDLDDSATRPALTVHAPFSRRKTHPLTFAHSEKSVRLGESKSAPLPNGEAQSASHFLPKCSASLSVSATRSPLFHMPISVSASNSQSSSAEHDNSPSLFRVNVLPPVASSLKYIKKTAGSLFASTRSFHDSKILRPSAMVRVLKPVMVSHQVKKSNVQGLRLSLTSMTSVASSSQGHVTVVQGADQASMGNLKDQGSRLFVKGQFKPVRVIVSPSNKSTAQPDMSRFDSTSSFSTVGPLAHANC